MTAAGAFSATKNDIAGILVNPTFDRLSDNGVEMLVLFMTASNRGDRPS